MSVRLHVVLDDDLGQRLKALAEQQDRALSRQVAYMLKRMLEDAPTNDRQPTHVEALGMKVPAAEVPEDLPPSDVPPEPEDPWWERPAS